MLLCVFFLSFARSHSIRIQSFIVRIYVISKLWKLFIQFRVTWFRLFGYIVQLERISNAWIFFFKFQFYYWISLYNLIEMTLKWYNESYCYSTLYWMPFVNLCLILHSYGNKKTRNRKHLAQCSCIKWPTSHLCVNLVVFVPH